MEWTREPGSFRDPSGFVFSSQGIVYRQVNAGFGEQYRRLIDSGLYAELSRDALLVAHEEVALRLPGAPPAFAVLKPHQIPFISYPYEWCFSQLKAAALLTLEVQKRALKRGLVLRDASAYNVQFTGSRPVFIDSLSFGMHEEGRPWAAYRQFCEHFLGPLALMSLVHPSLGQLSRIHIDGIPLELVRRLLPVSSHLRAGLLMHLHVHGRSLVTGPAQHTARPARPPRQGMGMKAMLGLMDSLSRTVESLRWTPSATLWSTYTDHLNYSESASHKKQLIIAQWLDFITTRSQVRTVWDMGANVGTYSLLAAERTSGLVVSFDLDHAAVEHHYAACRKRADTRVLPLLQDLANPSASLGWHHMERQSLIQRGPADVALALALIHHLAISGNVPLPSIAAFFAQLSRYLLVEFVPKEDSQLQRMLAAREDVFTDYSQERFEAAFQPLFEIVHTAAIEGTVRTLYLMKTRS